MSQLAVGQPTPSKEPFSVRKFLRQLKDAAFEIIPLVITLLLIIDFSIKEILPIIRLILHDLGFL
jgi:hypothetical protein